MYNNANLPRGGRVAEGNVVVLEGVGVSYVQL